MMPNKIIHWPWSYNPTDEAGFEQIYRQELPRVYNFFRYRLGEDLLAEDLTADTFTRAWQYRANYRHDLSAFSTWIFTIAHRVAIDYYRRSQSTSPLSDSSPDLSTPSPEDLALQRSDTSHLRWLLTGLTDREREVVALKYGAGLTNRDIARLIGLTESNVGVILHRTVQILRNRWEISHE
jgi:RNA polymerase sigma-70 factor, ECF subfamily